MNQFEYPESWTNEKGNHCVLISVVKHLGNILIIFTEQEDPDHLTYNIEFAEEIFK